MIQQSHFWVYTPKKLKAGSQRDFCTLLFTAALFTIAKRWKQPKGSSANEWVNKMWCIPTMEYYSALKRLNFPPESLHCPGQSELSSLLVMTCACHDPPLTLAPPSLCFREGRKKREGYLVVGDGVRGKTSSRGRAGEG